MRETMVKNDGCGLAGVQVGILRRVVVLDVNLQEGNRYAGNRSNYCIEKMNARGCEILYFIHHVDFWSVKTQKKGNSLLLCLTDEEVKYS